VELTEEGKVILDHAQRVLAEVDDLHGQMEALAGVMRGTVRIGGIYPFGPYDLYGVLADYRERSPGVAIHMVEDAVDEDAIGPEFAARCCGRRSSWWSPHSTTRSSSVRTSHGRTSSTRT
jgi:DNA-binding transcriptional LysR family regulator